MANKRKFEGIWIPAALWETKELSMQEKLFLVEINSLDNEAGCYASNGYFSEFFGLSKTRCSEVIKSLKEKGYLSVKIERNGKQISRRVLSILPHSENRTPLFGKPNTPIRKTEHPYSENCKENNTKRIIHGESNARAWDFLKINSVMRWEAWVMQHKNQLKDFENFVATFNDKVDMEELEYKEKILFARLNQLFRNWQRVDHKVRKLEPVELTTAHPAGKKIKFN